ncbi:cytochrome c oxidase subunit 3 family protein [Pseudolabrys taiwanensis]|uniref:Cytochrome c oxidase subunit 3 family protein n=1 Tax=Pseudolabrys taiwanensis TaxID=331696 RepID=A0A345ZZF0_9HYPH|nr:cytochrome c oxidase subunit 3 [Pseudolabrys taiwanensis]AXK82297.1 cytochrome c oxidase subunit 3 family protein [Pseudolabrys taiwanensis]
MPEAQPAFPYATLPQQHEAAQLGMWTFLATEILFFGGLVLAYLVYHYGYPQDFDAAARHTKIVLGTTNTAILLTSSFLVAWAVTAGKTGFGRGAAVLLAAAAGLGLIFLALKGLEYSEEYRERLVPALNFSFDAAHARGAQLFFVFYFVATGLHAIHVAVGIAILLAIANRARQQRYSADYHAPLTVAGLYWHFVDAVWVVLYALIYLPGRSGA